jgi:hypothetical protein
MTDDPLSYKREHSQCRCDGDDAAATATATATTTTTRERCQELLITKMVQPHRHGQVVGVDAVTTTACIILLLFFGFACCGRIVYVVGISAEQRTSMHCFLVS